MFNAEPKHCSICSSPLAQAGLRTCERAECHVAYQTHLELRKPTCAVCGRPVAEPARSGGVATCGQLNCQLQSLRFRPTDARPTCLVCGVPIPTTREGEDCCHDRDCAIIRSRWRVQEKAQHEQHLREQLELQARQLRDASAPSVAVHHPEHYLVAIVPHASPNLSAPDPERVQAARQHIETLVVQAVIRRPRTDDTPYQSSEFSDDASEAETPIFQSSCRLCKGHCCRQGETHAFLTIGTMRRVFSQHPELSPTEVVGNYVAHLPSRSVAGSCVFHGEFGCTLPRDWRADMCNRFLCRDLLRIRQARTEEPDKSFFIAATEEQTIHEAEFVGHDAVLVDVDISNQSGHAQDPPGFTP